MSPAFTGLKIKSELIIHSTYNTFINVPQGYTGGCFVFDTTYNAGSIRDVDFIGGISIQELGTPARQYSAVKFNGNMVDQGLTFGEFGNMHVYNCKRAIELDFVTAGSWLTTFKFKQIKAYYTTILCEVINTSNQAALGFSTTHFDFVGIQSAANTSHGFKGMEGNNNLFSNCAVWDVQNSLRDARDRPPQVLGDRRVGSGPVVPDEGQPLVEQARIPRRAQVVPCRQDGPEDDVAVRVLLARRGQRRQEVERLRPVPPGVLARKSRSSTSRTESWSPRAVSRPTGPSLMSRAPHAPPETCSSPRGER